MMALSNKRKNNHKESHETMTVPKKSISTAFGETNFKEVFNPEELGSVLKELPMRELMGHVVKADGQLELQIIKVCCKSSSSPI